MYGPQSPVISAFLYPYEQNISGIEKLEDDMVKSMFKMLEMSGAQCSAN